jgi:hypothetical protein
MKTSKMTDAEKVAAFNAKQKKDRSYWVLYALRMEKFTKAVAAKTLVDVTEAEVAAEYTKRFGK